MNIKGKTVGAALAAGLLLAGCSAVQGNESSLSERTYDDTAVSGEIAPAQGAPVQSASDAYQPAAAPSERQIVRSGSMSIVSDKVRDTMDSLRKLAATYEGLISAEEYYTSDDGREQSGSLTAMIPAESLDAYIEAAGKLGEVQSVQLNASDVTGVVADLDARISALSASISRLETLLREAGNVQSLLEVEAQLSGRQAELDSLTAQRKALGEQVALSSLTVSVAAQEAPPEPVETPGFSSGLSSGWAALVGIVGAGLTALGYLLPFLALLVVVAGAVGAAMLLRRRKKTTRSSASSEEDAT